MRTASSLCAAAREALDSVPDGPLSIDLSGVDFLDSTGIGALIATRNEAEARSRTMLVVNPSPRARQVIRVCALLDEFGLGAD